MQGMFKKKISDSIIIFVCGLLFCALIVFVKMDGNKIWCIVAGIGICFYGIISFFFNYNAFLHVEDDHIKGKYHLAGKIDCSLSDISFAVARGKGWKTD